MTLAAAGMLVAYADRYLVPDRLAVWGFSYAFEEVVSLAVPLVGFVLASRRPGNCIGWLFLAAGLALGLRALSRQYALHALVAAPGSWPAGRVFGWLFNWVWVIPLAVVAFVFLISRPGTCAHRGGARRRGRWPVLWLWPPWVRW